MPLRIIKTKRLTHLDTISSQTLEILLNRHLSSGGWSERGWIVSKLSTIKNKFRTQISFHDDPQYFGANKPIRFSISIIFDPQTNSISLSRRIAFLVPFRYKAQAAHDAEVLAFRREYYTELVYAGIAKINLDLTKSLSNPELLLPAQQLSPESLPDASLYTQIGPPYHTFVMVPHYAPRLDGTRNLRKLPAVSIYQKTKEGQYIFLRLEDSPAKALASIYSPETAPPPILTKAQQRAVKLDLQPGQLWILRDSKPQDSAHDIYVVTKVNIMCSTGPSVDLKGPLGHIYPWLLTPHVFSQDSPSKSKSIFYRYRPRKELRD